MVKPISELVRPPRVKIPVEVIEQLKVANVTELTAKIDEAIKTAFGIEVVRNVRGEVSIGKSVAKLAKEFGKTEDEIKAFLEGKKKQKKE